MIVENSVAAGDLVSKLLDYARVGAQDHNDQELVALAPVLQQIARRFQPLAEKKQLYLKVEAGAAEGAAEGGPAVLTDRQKLERIISNLVDNAIKYTAHGGVTLALAVREGDEACVRVADTGMGIPHGSIPYLFDEFYQVNNYERDRSKGFGMGLAICQCLARQLGGSVRLAGTSNAGSCFELLLPAAAVRPDRGGRPGGAQGDVPDPQAAGLCGV
jgi:signal transduction histidine kinase